MSALRSPIFKLSALVLAASYFTTAAQSADAPKPAKPKSQWEKMDYGPYIAVTIDVGKGNTALKGLVISLDPERKTNVCFDTELMRVAGAWTGGWHSGGNPAFTGAHGQIPSASGTIQYATKIGPGWAKDGSFDDPRAPITVPPPTPKKGEQPGQPTITHDGPLPANWAKYKGLYVNGDKVVISYTVGDCKVLEMEGAETIDGETAFSRTFQVGPSTKPLTLLVCESEKAQVTAGYSYNAAMPSGSASLFAIGSVIVGAVNAPPGAKWQTGNGRITLDVPALTASASFRLVIGNLGLVKNDAIKKFMKDPPESLEPLTHGGPARYAQTITTKGVLAEADAVNAAKRRAEDAAAAAAKKKVAEEFAAAKKSIDEKGGDANNKPADPKAAETARKEAEKARKDAEEKAMAQARKDAIEHFSKADEEAALKPGPYMLDTLTLPDTNPWNAWMRLGGLDFFSDGKRAAVSTWSGDVWIVSGIDATLSNLTWKRFATGLFQPLGLKIVNDQIYTLGRDQITRFYDYNNDGEADYYENFNNDCIVTVNFHEFAFDLQTDSQGNFYFTKASPVRAGGGGFERISAHNGCILKISKDGSKLEVFATGFRAPNGMSVGPHDEVVSSDNEGTWTPTTPINFIKKGGFYGVVDSAHRDAKPAARDNPICWLPHYNDNSGGGQVWVTSDKWGPFKGELLHLSYGKCTLWHVMVEHLPDGDIQGGACRLTINEKGDLLKFASGGCRPRFNPVDGQLYIAALKGWQTDGGRDGCLQRVRYTGKPANLPLSMKATRAGIEITFTDKLDRAAAEDLANYAVWWFDVKWTSAYGSSRYSPTDSAKKHGKDDALANDETLPIKSAKLSSDGKTVSLEIPGLKPVTNIVTKIKIQAADGTKVNCEIDSTINELPR